ncbi:MAG: MaoC family dehydratase N-terminal domain-containing protein [Deltaproteobacteria bacterium]|nr:MaoC family dehydratase N-terminal domain-containing protein [Deltaproteobacteria bacterium]
MATQTKYFEDFQLGEKFHIPPKTMTDERFLAFAEITGDSHPIHYDDDYAKTTRFGKRVAHGLLVTALTAVGASTLSPLLEGSIVAFVEQSSRFLKPVLIGDTITPEIEVSELVPKTEVGLVRLKTRVLNQRGEVVLEGMHAYLIKKRPRS